MKTKIINESFDEKNGTTIVTIQNKYGHFTGVAMCHPDDSFSPFQGERIAATKANIEFLKFRIKQTKAESNGIKKLLSEDSQYEQEDNYDFSEKDGIHGDIEYLYVLDVANYSCNDIYYDTNISSSVYVGPVWKHALVKLERYEKDIENFKDGIEILKDSIVKMDKERQEVLKRSKQNK